MNNPNNTKLFQFENKSCLWQHFKSQINLNSCEITEINKLEMHFDKTSEAIDVIDS